MYFVKGVLKNVMTQTIRTANAEFDKTILQVEGKTANGRIILEDIVAGKEKVSKALELKSQIGKEIEIPVAVIVKNGYKNVYLQ